MESIAPKEIKTTGLTGWTRSMGYKFTVVCLLALVMTIPSLFVDSLVDERSGRSGEVLKEVSERVGGPQNFLGPTLVVPYTVPSAVAGSTEVQHGLYFFSPAVGDVRVDAVAEERRISLFRVPVYKSDVKMTAHFDVRTAPQSLPAGAALEWERAEVLAGVADTRGALADGTMTFEGAPQQVAPSRLLETLQVSREDKGSKLVMLGAHPQGLVAPGVLDVAVNLRFSGAQRISVLPFARSTHIAIASDWKHPGFVGAFAPRQQSVSSDGFTAEWQIPSMARSASEQGGLASLGAMQAEAVGVNFVEVADPYQQVTRSLKYVLLFVAMVFLSYFVFEVTTGRRVHPAQYVLVGIAQLIFYLLLLSFAERLGFGWAFLIAGVATVGLLSINAKWVFVSGREGVRALVVFSILYTLIYMLLGLEDNALLVGACASFALVAAVMYFTRGIDWYGVMRSGKDAEENA